jgi:hypothetical protein
MKHLKKFNESREELKLQKEELQEFCEMYLSYLTDEGFEISIQVHEASDSWPCIGKKNYPELGYQTNYFRVKLGKPNSAGPGFPFKIFLWEEVSDRFIPFVKYLIDNYNLLKIDPRSTVTSIQKSRFNLEFATGHNIKFQSKELLDNSSSLEGKKLRSISFVVGLPK